MRTTEETRARSVLIERMSSERVLWAAWSRVAAGSGMAGADGVTTMAFGRDLGPRLAALGRLLHEGEYRPQPLRPVRVIRGGRPRIRGLPTVCDRIAQRAFLNVCGARLNPENSSVSFSYRQGRSWLNAIEQVQRYRDSGLHWVLRSDIADFFAEIDHRLLSEVVTERLADHSVAKLVDSWVRAPLLAPGGTAVRARGLPEGAPVSPALAEAFLADFDREVNGRSGSLVRYADDLTVLCTGPDEAMAALADVERALTARRLRINPDKTCIASFDFGFTLLGWQFVGVTAEPAGARSPGSAGAVPPPSTGVPAAGGRR
jgi:RNA-directed DNA polymerase